MKKILLSSLLLVSLATLNAQETIRQPESCASDAINIKMMQDFPAISVRMAEFEKTAQRPLATAKKTASSYIIPVVIHVMHKGEPLGTGTNISDAQIIAKIKAINEEFRKVPGSLGAGNGVDIGLEFALAVVDPLGQPTSGITRHNMSPYADYMQYGIKYKSTVGMEDATLKGLAFWDSNYYYNFWTLSEFDDNEGSRYGIQAYAYLAAAHGYAIDGTMVSSNSFKNPNSRAETHELGHAFNLYHTFEGDNDGNACPGTGNQAASGQSDGCSDTAPHNRNDNDCSAISNTCYPNNSDLAFVNNYMSYSYNECKNMFTPEQKNRIISALTTIRSSFLSDGVKNFEPVAAPTANYLPLKPTVISAGTAYGFTDISNEVPNTYLSSNNWSGMTFNWNVSNNSGTSFTSTNQNAVFTFTEPGIYNVSHSVSNGLGNSTKSYDNLIYVSSPIATLPSTTLSSQNNGNYGYTVSYVNFNDIEVIADINKNIQYIDFSNSAKTLVVAGSSYPLTITLKSGATYPEYCSVYIDYNNNGNFEESEKVATANIPKATALTNFTSMITIPNTALKNTLLRMRVAGSAATGITNAMINGNGSFFIGDTKDFGLYVINNQALKTDDFEANNSNMSFYPNPVKDILNLNNTEAIEKVEIYSITGQLLLSENFHDTSIKIDLSEFKSGTYIAAIYSNDKKSAIKILKN